MTIRREVRLPARVVAVAEGEGEDAAEEKNRGDEQNEDGKVEGFHGLVATGGCGSAAHDAALRVDGCGGEERNSEDSKGAEFLCA